MTTSACAVLLGLGTPYFYRDMGLFDDTKDALGDIDFDEPHEWGNGFNPDVCKDCEHHVTDKGPNRCGLCGCPTIAVAPMSLAGAPPSSCPYLEEHAEESG